MDTVLLQALLQLVTIGWALYCAYALIVRWTNRR